MLLRYAIKIQKIFRGFRVRKRIAKLIKAISLIESAFKRYKARKNFERMMFCKSIILKAFDGAWSVIYKKMAEIAALTI